MKSPNAQNTSSEVLEVNSSLRWQIFLRLQELDIACECSYYQPLRVNYNSSLDSIQIWSVVKQFSAPKKELVSFLNKCWY